MPEADGSCDPAHSRVFDASLVALSYPSANTKATISLYLTENLDLAPDIILRRYRHRLSPIATCASQRTRCSECDPVKRTRRRPTNRLCDRGLRTDRYVPPEVQSPCSPMSNALFALPHQAPMAVSLDDDPRPLLVSTLQRLRVGPLRAHLYDLGQARGFLLAGVDAPMTSGRAMTH